MTTPAVRIWYAVIVSFTACIAVAVTSVLYAGHVQRQAASERAQLQRELLAQQRQSDQRWCSLLVNLSESQRKRPPTTPSGRDFAREIEDLRRQFGCPEPPK